MVKIMWKSVYDSINSFSIHDLLEELLNIKSYLAPKLKL